MHSIAQIILGTVAMTVFGVVVGQLFAGVDRILAARMQARVGPPLERSRMWCTIRSYRLAQERQQ